MTRIPSLETARLILRPFVAGDLDDLAEILADPEVVYYLPGGQPKTRQQAEATLAYIANHWETRGFGWWAAVLKADNKLAGWCGLKVFENTPEVELLYLLAKAYWNQGLASEAARASLRYGFEELKLERIVAFAVAENRASTRVMGGDLNERRPNHRHRRRHRRPGGGQNFARRRPTGQTRRGSPAHRRADVDRPVAGNTA